MVALLFMADTISIGADLAVIGEAAGMSLDGSQHVFTILFALASLLRCLLIGVRNRKRLASVTSVLIIPELHLDEMSRAWPQASRC